MALRADYDLNGVTFPNAYIKVYCYQGNQQTQKVEFGVYTEPHTVMFHSFAEVMDIDPEGGSPLVQAYEHLKTLPAFADAIDA